MAGSAMWVRLTVIGVRMSCNKSEAQLSDSAVYDIFLKSFALCV